MSHNTAGTGRRGHSQQDRHQSGDGARNSDEPEEAAGAPGEELRTCALAGCQATFPTRAGASGRPRMYCSDAHRLEAWRLRRIRREDGPDAALRHALDALSRPEVLERLAAVRDLDERHLRSQIEEATARVRAETAERYAASERRLAEALAELDDLTVENAELAARTGELEDALARARADAEEASARLRLAEDEHVLELNTLRAENEERFEALQALYATERSAWVAERSALIERCETMAAELGALRERAVAVEAQRAALIERCETMAAEFAARTGELEDALARARTEAEEVSARLAHVEQAAEEERRRAGALDTALRETNNRVVELAAIRDALVARVGEHEAAAYRLEKELEDRNERLGWALAELNRRGDEIAALGKALEDALATNEALEELRHRLLSPRSRQGTGRLDGHNQTQTTDAD